MNNILKAACTTFVITMASGCASKPPIEIANPKRFQSGEQALVFGGEYQIKENQLSISINGDSVMRGRFLPFTPTKRMNANYEGNDVQASCYFGSILSKKLPGVKGMIAGVIQSEKGVSGNTCRILVNGAPAVTLYFEKSAA